MEDYDANDIGEDTDEKDAILKALRRISSITKLNDSEFLHFVNKIVEKKCELSFI